MRINNFKKFDSVISGRDINIGGVNGHVNVNGIEIDVPDGANINVINGKVYIDGKKYKGEEVKGVKIANLIIKGNAGSIDCGGNVEIAGNVEGDIDCGGSVRTGI